jgi:3-oxoacyl-[acyl-carrier-protein (ACP)] synthase III-like protein
VIPLVVGAFGTHFGAQQPLSTLSEELAEDQIEALAKDFDHVLVADQEIWESAATAAENSLAHADLPPDLIVYLTENDSDTTASTALIGEQLGLGAVPRLAISGHECGNLGPALHVVSDALATRRARRVLLIVADHANPGARLMRNGMSYFSDGAAACLIAPANQDSVPGFELGCRIGEGAVVITPGAPTQPPDIRATVASIRAATNTLSTVNAAQAVLLGHYRDEARTFLHTATGLHRLPLLQTKRQRCGHIFGADHLLAFADLAGDTTVFALALGPWTTSAFMIRPCA